MFGKWLYVLFYSYLGPQKSELGSNGNEGILQIFQSSKTGTSPSNGI